MARAKHRRFVLSSVSSGLAACALAICTARAAEPPYPRLANMYLQGGFDPAYIPALSRWDVLILDPLWSRSQLQQLKAMNPRIKIFFYVCAYCMQVPSPSDVWRTQNYNYAVANDLWWRNWNRTIASDWPGSQLVNITDLCPAGPQGTWRQYMAQRVEDLVTQFPELDGVFYDNFWKSIAWEQGGAIQVDSDCNPTHNPAGCNGIMDSDAVVDTLWNHALSGLAQETRTRFDGVVARRGGPPLAIVTNSSADYFGSLNGTLHEYFPSGSSNPDPGNAYGYNWNQEMLALPSGYLVAPFRTTPYTVSVLNADWSGTANTPDRTPDFERHKRFTLASALMGDGYYSLDAADIGHGNIWWEPEYDNGGRGKGYLGFPLGPMRRIGVPSGPELVTNGIFTASLAPWQTLQFHGTGAATLDAASYHSAPSSVRLDTGTLQADGYLKLWENVSVLTGHGYSLSFWARASSAQNLVLHLYSAFCPGYRCLSDQTIALATTWQRYEIPFVSAGSALAGFNILAMKSNSSVWLDDVSLREGDTSVYRRDFDHGTVVLNYTTTTQTIALGGTYHHLKVPGSTLYDGAAVTQETVAASDARILLNDVPAAVPAPVPSARLEQNTPNPFNPTTVIHYQVAHTEHVLLAVYDAAGHRVRTLVDQVVAAGGERSAVWDGTDGAGTRVRSGVYFCRIETPSFTDRKKLTLVK